MPRPPILPYLDWQGIWSSGKTWIEWLAGAENDENADRMRAATTDAHLSDMQRAWLGSLSRPVHVVAFAEDWCGDVQRFVPVLERLAAHCPNLLVRYMAREDQAEAFKRFLTNGGEAVPKFVFLNEHFVECGHWGPMPAQHRILIARGKAAGNVGEARAKVAKLYDADPESREATREMIELIDIAATVAS